MKESKNLSYWERQALKHRRAASTLYKKAERYVNTDRKEFLRWNRQATSNEEAARKCDRIVMEQKV